MSDFNGKFVQIPLDKPDRFVRIEPVSSDPSLVRIIAPEDYMVRFADMRLAMEYYAEHAERREQT